MTDRYQIFSAELGARYSSLPPRLKQLADLVSSNPDDVAHWTVSVLAQHANVQPSTVVRFTKTFGFKGYSDFQALSENDFADWHHPTPSACKPSELLTKRRTLQ